MINIYCVKPEPQKFVGEVKMRNMKGNVRIYQAVSNFEYQLYKKIKNGFSPIIMICGEQRIGKSAYALHICNNFSQFMYEEDFNFKKYSFYDTERVIEEMENMNKRVILIDEGGESLDYLDWYERIAKAMRSMINTQAFRGNLYVIINPFVVEILKNIRKHFNFKCHVVDRGYVKIWKYVKKHHAEKQDKASYPVFLDYMRFKLSDIPSGMYEDYKAFSEAEKEIIREKRQIEIKQKKRKPKLTVEERLEKIVKDLEGAA